jgi:phage terminase large subunit GpA-like protein
MCHMPGGRHEEWFKQLVGERLMTRYDRKKQPVREWIRQYQAVEALDCRVYAHAALLLSDVELERIAHRPAGQASVKRRRRSSSSGDAFAPDGWGL